MPPLSYSVMLRLVINVASFLCVIIINSRFFDFFLHSGVPQQTYSFPLSQYFISPHSRRGLHFSNWISSFPHNFSCSLVCRLFVARPSRGALLSGAVATSAGPTGGAPPTPWARRCPSPSSSRAPSPTPPPSPSPPPVAWDWGGGRGFCVPPRCFLRNVLSICCLYIHTFQQSTFVFSPLENECFDHVWRTISACAHPNGDTCWGRAHPKVIQDAGPDSQSPIPRPDPWAQKPALLNCCVNLLPPSLSVSSRGKMLAESVNR